MRHAETQASGEKARERLSAWAQQSMHDGPYVSPWARAFVLIRQWALCIQAARCDELIWDLVDARPRVA